MKKRNSVWGLRKKQEIFFGEHYHFKLKKLDEIIENKI
jgi:hypothetical protein